MSVFKTSFFDKVNQLKTVLFCYLRLSNLRSPFGFFFVPKRVFTFLVTQLEGLRTDGVTKVQLVKPSGVMIPGLLLLTMSA